MVKLSLTSPYNEKDTPFLYKWDVEYRLNHAKYQDEIDKLTYHLQRSRSGLGPFGSWIYPGSQQSSFFLLELLKKKQAVGKIFPDELETYRPLNPNISDDLNRTFRAQWNLPITGLAIGGALNVYGFITNMPYSFKIGFFVLPVALEVVYNMTYLQHKKNSLEFLNWLISYRTARTQLEVDAPYFQQNVKQIFQKLRHTTKIIRPLEDIYKELLDIVRKEATEELKLDKL